MHGLRTRKLGFALFNAWKGDAIQMLSYSGIAALPGLFLVRFFRSAMFFACCIVLLGPVPQGKAANCPDEPGTSECLVPACLLGFDWGQGPAYALVVEKTSQTISVYEWRHGTTLKYRLPCSTGEASGRKEKAGDRKTPEGVYFFNKACGKKYLSATYGNGAFVTDYPNLVDRLHHRDGNNIWLHGTNKALKPRDSNGCVAVTNGNLDVLAKLIRMNRTPMIIKERVRLVSRETVAARRRQVEAFLTTWQDAFNVGHRQAYLQCYRHPPKDAERLWRGWDMIRKEWVGSGMPFRITWKNMTLAQGDTCIVALFDEFVALGPHSAKAGIKKVFLEPDHDSWKILGEEYQPGTVATTGQTPILAAIMRLDRFRKNYKAVTDLIAQWAEAWSAKDIVRYRACYAQDFYSKKMDLDAWIRYKKRLNKRYDWIKVTIEDMEISEDGDRITATFLQTYESSANRFVGIKRLRLKRIGQAWKIYRETWHKI